MPLNDTQSKPPWKLHEVFVLFGQEAVEAYEDGEENLHSLQQLGAVERLEFNSIPELNAFIQGVELARGHTHALPVEDLLELA